MSEIKTYIALKSGTKIIINPNHIKYDPKQDLDDQLIDYSLFIILKKSDLLYL